MHDVKLVNRGFGNLPSRGCGHVVGVSVVSVPQVHVEAAVGHGGHVQGGQAIYRGND